MKKIISVFLALVIICTCVSIAFAGEVQRDLSIAVASDLHFCPTAAELEKTNDDPIFWYANRRAAMENESGFIIDAFLEQCANDEDVQYVLIPGDITDSGYYYPEQHSLAAAKLREFEEKSGKQVFVINGNHDVRNGEFKHNDFKNVYAGFGYDLALETREKDCSYSADLGEKYRLIALDSCNYNESTADGMTADKMDWVRKQTEKAKKDGRYPILMMHHNLLEHMPLQTVISKNFIVKAHTGTADLLANWGIKTVLTGHEHCSDVTSYTSPLGNVITDFATTALTMYPLSYRLISFNEDEIKYISKAVESIDTEALSEVSAGYTPQMLDAMNGDLNGYAKGFLKKGVEYRLALSLSPEKLGLDENAFYYDFVMNLVNTLTFSLERPLYGRNSLGEASMKYGISLPYTDYKNGWDILTQLVSKHYEGSESYTLDSPEVTLLLRSVAVILREEFASMGSGVFSSAANELSAKSGFGSFELDSLTRKAFGGISPVEYFTVALLAPFLYEFAFDSDGVEDNNGTLPGYGTVNTKTNSENLGNKFKAFFTKLQEYIKLVFSYISKIFA